MVIKKAAGGGSSSAAGSGSSSSVTGAGKRGPAVETSVMVGVFGTCRSFQILKRPQTNSHPHQVTYLLCTYVHAAFALVQATF